MRQSEKVEQLGSLSVQLKIPGRSLSRQSAPSLPASVQHSEIVVNSPHSISLGHRSSQTVEIGRAATPVSRAEESLSEQAGDAPKSAMARATLRRWSVQEGEGKCELLKIIHCPDFRRAVGWKVTIDIKDRSTQGNAS
ncbi:MAG: hypothetical protein JKY86_01240 [Gammaproteobacteria bacterium]|nr:hypothetical protein [Gammaproteobacteria bacterium]